MTTAAPQRHPAIWHLLHDDPANPEPPTMRTPSLAAAFTAQQSQPPDRTFEGEYQTRLGVRTVRHLVRRLLLDHGWLPDDCRITWVYPDAFVGAGPDGLPDDRLAECGPHPPILRLDPDQLTVVPHGQTHGCPRHLRTADTTVLRDPNQFDAIAAAVTAIEHAAVTADADAYRRCLDYGDCGHIVDDCESGRRPWPGDPTVHEINQARFTHHRTPKPRRTTRP